MMWSKHSRRIDPISRSTKPFCQGEAGEIGLSRMPMARSRLVRIASKFADANHPFGLQKPLKDRTTDFPITL